LNISDAQVGPKGVFELEYIDGCLTSFDRLMCYIVTALDMIPINGCFEDVLQLWPLFFDVNCRLPPVIDGCFKDVLQ